MKCFYHNDADGKCAAFWVRNAIEKGIRYDEEYLGYDKKYITADYNKPLPLDTVRRDEEVFIVDFSISPEEMVQLMAMTKDITWIDHHKTAIEKYANFPYIIRGIRRDGIAGCMLTYCYMNHMTDRGCGEILPFNPETTNDAPMFTKLLADWDVWKFEYGDETRQFQVAFNAYNFHPESNSWDTLMNEDCRVMIGEGISMMRYRDGWAEQLCRSKGFYTEFEGHRCFALNLPLCNSEFFKSVDPSSYEILTPFSFNGESWSVSLYSKTVDVSEIAKKYGGGGHKGASGFNCTELPFKKA